VEAGMRGQVSGFVRTKGKTLERSGVPFGNISFITTPIDQLGGRVLLIASEVSPERTWIVAIDKTLSASLLYASDRDFEIKGSDFGPIGSVYQVQVSEPGVFLLQERKVPGDGPRGFFSPLRNRVFKVDVSTGAFAIAAMRDTD
jgi:hypothetical protein